MKARLLAITICMLLLAAVVPITPVFAATTYYVDDDGGADFTTIGDAVAAATAGDTIIVKDGTYVENVTVDKTLTIQSENGAASTTVTAAVSATPVFDVNASGVVIDGFSVLGPTDSHVAGIELVDVSDCTIQNNDSSLCYNGIHLGGASTNNTVNGNYCHENTQRGISVRDTANGNYISANTVESNLDDGFCIKDTSHDNFVWLNNVINNNVEMLTANTYNSPAEITYTYGGSTYTGYLGNYYYNYAGSDADGDGVGDTPYSFGTYSDNYPLMAQSENYITETEPSEWYITYLGGTGSDGANSIVLDNAGDIYIGGDISSTDFPVTAGAYQPASAGGSDVFLTEFDSGGNLVYSTYLGGSSTDYGEDIGTDNMGNAYLTGRTKSTDFPTTASAYQPTKAGTSTRYDAFLSKFDSGGNLAYSTYLGGDLNDGGRGIATDSAGNVYIIGYTGSANFPITAGAYQTTLVGSTGYDAFLAKFDSSGSLAYSTYLGGTGDDYGNDVFVDGAGNVHIIGYTSSADFPVTAGAYQATLAGGKDIFYARFDASGSLAYSTYLGGPSDEEGNDITLDGTGNVYLTGYTSSADFPVTAGAYQATLAGSWDAFAVRFDSDGNLVYSTYFGGSIRDETNPAQQSGEGIAVDGEGNIHITGKTNADNFPVTPDAYQATRASTNTDVFLTEFDSGGNLVYSTYLGGSDVNSQNFGTAIAVDSAGNAYITGETDSAAFPVTADAYQTTNAGGYDAFFARRTAAAPEEPLTTSSSLSATTEIVMPTIGIEINRDSIDYGDIAPGESSAVETVGITNTGNLDCDVTLEVDGVDATAQDFYEQSLYIDGALYDMATVIASIAVSNSQDVDTQLQVPLSWAEPGVQEATFIFWAEASP